MISYLEKPFKQYFGEIKMTDIILNDKWKIVTDNYGNTHLIIYVRLKTKDW